VTLTGAWNYRENFLYNVNLYQSEAIVALEDYVEKNPDFKIYDIIGILPRKNKIFIFAGPSEVAQKTQIIEDIIKAEPDILLLVFKFIYLEPDFPFVLEKHWVPMSPDIWVKGKYISPTMTPLNFIKSATIDGLVYWIMPYMSQKYIINNKTHALISNETLALDHHLKINTKDPEFLAIPQKYTSIVLTDIPIVHLPNPPSVLFRYDTSF
jgi:hypothetical protein